MKNYGPTKTKMSTGKAKKSCSKCKAAKCGCSKGKR